MLLSFPRSMTGINYQWSLIRGNSACLDTWLFYGFPPLLAEEGLFLKWSGVSFYG